MLPSVVPVSEPLVSVVVGPAVSVLVSVLCVSEPSVSVLSVSAPVVSVPALSSISPQPGMQRIRELRSTRIVRYELDIVFCSVRCICKFGAKHSTGHRAPLELQITILKANVSWCYDIHVADHQRCVVRVDGEQSAGSLCAVGSRRNERNRRVA